MLWWIKFWRVKPYLLAYFSLIRENNGVPWNIHLILCLIITELLHLLHLCFFANSDDDDKNSIDRLTNFDLTLLWNCHPKVNLLHISINLQIVYFFYCTFYLVANDRRLAWAIAQTYQVLYLHDNRPFLLRNSYEKVAKFTRLYINTVVASVVLFVAGINLLNHVQLFRLIFEHFDLLFTTLEGLCCRLPRLLLFKTAFDFRIDSGTLVNVIASVVIVAFTATTFIRLRQANELLENRLQVSYYSKSHLPAITFAHFATYHTSICTSVEHFKALINEIVVGYLIVEMPVNTFTSIEVFQGNNPKQKKIGLMASLIIISILATQYIVIFGFHLLAALYSAKMHSCTGALWKVNLRASRDGGNGEKRINLKFRLKLAAYLEKVSTDNRYGICYGNFSLITMFSFAKVTKRYF